VADFIVVTKLRFACGCGFHTDSIALAESHVRTTGHTIVSISGSVTPVKPRVAYQPAVRPVIQVVHDEKASAQFTSQAEELKARLKNGKK